MTAFLISTGWIKKNPTVHGCIVYAVCVMCRRISMYRKLHTQYSTATGLMRITVHACVVTNNVCFGSHLSGEPSCLLVQVVGQVHCLSKYRYIFSIDL